LSFVLLICSNNCDNEKKHKLLKKILTFKKKHYNEAFFLTFLNEILNRKNILQYNTEQKAFYHFETTTGVKKKNIEKKKIHSDDILNIAVKSDSVLKFFKYFERI
jgi:hypothetical protein